jgi:hypothetical protein
MSKDRKPHPADIANAINVADAVKFEISLFLGAGKFAKAEATTLADARAAAAKLAADNPTASRLPLIYGITADGRNGLVTDATPSTSTNETETKTMTTKPKKAKGKAAKKSKAKKTAPKSAPKKNLGQRAAILAAAESGKLPAAPDFSAETHKRFRAKLAEVVALVKAGDIAKLQRYKINPVSTSPRAIARYRDLAVIALKAKAG